MPAMAPGPIELGKPECECGNLTVTCCHLCALHGASDHAEMAATGVQGDGGDQVGEGEAEAELRPGLTFSLAATKLKDRGLGVPSPSARPTGPDLKPVLSYLK